METPTATTITNKPIFTVNLTLPMVEFDPDVHLNVGSPAYQMSMEELGLSGGISETAVTAPFSLFTEDAVHLMRREILSDQVLDNFSFASSINSYQVRGFSKQTPFTTAAWTHPKTIAAVSKLAGVDLVPVFDYEIAHTNISTAGDTKPVVGWHNDSYPFVCVLMVSDTNNMVGGETVIQKGSGEMVKVADPKMGHATILQGGYILHMASRPAELDRERITLVTSFRPRDAMIKDDSVLTTVKPISDKQELFKQWMSYRADVLSKRFQKMHEGLESGELGNDEVMKLFEEQEQWIAHTLMQMGEVEYKL
ncbi:hypothetical protein CJU89_5520 [Yarrowia sp. B02]|nr:hypothetical protein CJU89_5520 [Yarrowia sp. B02]